MWTEYHEHLYTAVTSTRDSSVYVVLNNRQIFSAHRDFDRVELVMKADQIVSFNK